LTQTEGTQLYWVVPKSLAQPEAKFPSASPETGLTEHHLTQAQQLLSNADSLKLVPLSAWGIESIDLDDQQQMKITLLQSTEQTIDLTVDRVLACHGYLPGADYRHNLNLTPRADFPCVTAEPHFYLIGDRCQSVVPSGRSIAAVGLHLQRQIRDTFALIGGRADLDLYHTVKPLSVNWDDAAT
jgi:hypothetical protein